MSQNIERQLALVTSLSSAKRGLSRRQIFQRLPGLYPSDNENQAEASRKKLQRDADALAALGMPVFSSADADGEERYQLAPGSEALPDSFRLDTAEASSLRALMDDPVFCQQLNEPALRALSNLLAFHAPFDESGKGEAMEHSQDEARLARLLGMARSETAALIAYPSHTGKSETRVVSPVGGMLYRGKSYLVAVCHRDSIVKSFALTRIGRLEVSGEGFQPPPKTFSLEEHAGRNAFRLENDIGLRKVELKVSAEEAWRLRESWPEAIVEERPDGAIRALFEVTSPRRFYRYALAFGPHAEIVGPPEIRDGFATFLRSCL